MSRKTLACSFPNVSAIFKDANIKPYKAAQACIHNKNYIFPPTMKKSDSFEFLRSVWLAGSDNRETEEFHGLG